MHRDLSLESIRSQGRERWRLERARSDYARRPSSTRRATGGTGLRRRCSITSSMSTTRHSLRRVRRRTDRCREWELYDLVSDPDETVNLASRRDQSARLRELKAKLEQLRRDLGDVDPAGPPPVSPPCHGG
jgi:hypothetical protein